MKIIKINNKYYNSENLIRYYFNTNESEEFSKTGKYEICLEFKDGNSVEKILEKITFDLSTTEFNKVLNNKRYENIFKKIWLTIVKRFNFELNKLNNSKYFLFIPLIFVSILLERNNKKILDFDSAKNELTTEINTLISLEF